MTVICYRNGILAADSLFVYDNSRKCSTNTVKKIFTTRHDIWAFTGCPFNVMKFIHDSRVKLDEDATVIQFRKDAKNFQEITSRGSINIGMPDFFAVGCGADAALGAFYMGATATEAVEAACQVSIYCGLPVEQIEICK